jgi:hypothetical protein
MQKALRIAKNPATSEADWGIPGNILAIVLVIEMRAENGHAGLIDFGAKSRSTRWF